MRFTVVLELGDRGRGGVGGRRQNEELTAQPQHVGHRQQRQQREHLTVGGGGGGGGGRERERERNRKED